MWWSRGRLAQNIGWGVKHTLKWSAGFVVWVSVMALLTGGENLRARGLSLPGTITLYALGGIFAGIVIGALRPVLATYCGAVLVGLLAAYPPTVVALLMFRADSSMQQIVLGAAIVDLVLIPVYVWVLRRRFRRPA